MKLPNKADMAEATRLTRLGRLDEAMAILSGQAEIGIPADGVIDMTPPTDGSGAWTARSVPPHAASPLDGLMDRLNAHLPGLNTMSGMGGTASHKTRLPEGASFDAHSFANAAGQRPYKLYVPAAHKGPGLPLVVMLHGCTQSPDDFAAGTRMNELAEEFGFLVAYPGQTQTANPQKCWNWFNAADQQRETGEASLIAGLTRDIIRTQGVDPRRVFVAGLSAGGAAAAIMGSAYPDLYAAIGVHSGLACGAAKDMPSAFGAMNKGAVASVRANGTFVPAIVFHGDSDTTVHVINGEQVVTQARASSRLKQSVTTDASPGGVRYTRTTESDDAGRCVIEHWVLHGAGHAWSGGSSAGSYTDPRGPDASREMVRFFLSQAS